MAREGNSNLGHNVISRTSVWAAAARAFGAREPDKRVRNPDYLAARFLGPEELALLGGDPLADALHQNYDEASKDERIVADARTLIPRTRFIDRRLKAAILEGATQVVILGAGFDTRAYRFIDLLTNARVFEVDLPTTQLRKMFRTRDAIDSVPPNVIYVPLDLRRERLNLLSEAGYQPNVITFFIWEGVSMYLPSKSVRETLFWVAKNSAPGSRLVFDYTYDIVIRTIANIDFDNLSEPEKHSVLRFQQLTTDEPWIFGLPDEDEEDFLRSYDLDLRHFFGLNSREAVDMYLTRADGTIFGTTPPSEEQSHLILEAAVTGHRISG